MIELRHLTKLELSLVSGGFALGCVGLLFYILYITKVAPGIWKFGLLSCGVGLFVAFVLIFVPFYSRYAAVVGITGVFVMLFTVAVDRRASATRQGLKPSESRAGMLWAAGIIAVVAMVSVPFFAVINNQEVIKDTQSGAIGLLLRMESKLDRFLTLLERDFAQRERQDEETRIFRAEFRANQRTLIELSGGIATEQKKVRKDLKGRSSTRVQPLYVYPETPMFAPLRPSPGMLQLSPDRVQPLPTEPPRRRKIRPGKNQTGYLDDDSLNAGGYVVRRGEREPE